MTSNFLRKAKSGFHKLLLVKTKEGSTYTETRVPREYKDLLTHSGVLDVTEQPEHWNKFREQKRQGIVHP
jgi:hypothetical protein